MFRHPPRILPFASGSDHRTSPWIPTHYSLDTTWGTNKNTAVVIPCKGGKRLTRGGPAKGVSTTSSRGRRTSKFLSARPKVNSYQPGVCTDGRFTAVARPGGWTRGLAFAGDTAFVGTSRVLPRFAQYAPGLDPARCRCGVHAIDARSGRMLTSLVWPLRRPVLVRWNHLVAAGAPAHPAAPPVRRAKVR